MTYVLVRLPALAGERVPPPDAPALDFEPPGFALWRARELDRRRADLDRRIGPDRSARETLADYGSPTRSHRFRHIHRDADGVPEIHDDIIDLVFVTSGEGGVLAGGEMLDRDGSRGFRHRRGDAATRWRPATCCTSPHACRTATSCPRAVT